jgi:hypothetical protein
LYLVLPSYRIPTGKNRGIMVLQTLSSFYEHFLVPWFLTHANASNNFARTPPQACSSMSSSMSTTNSTATTAPSTGSAAGRSSFVNFFSQSAYLMDARVRFQ